MRVLAFGEGAETWETTISQNCPNIEVIASQGVVDTIPNLEDVEVLIGWRFPETLLQRLLKLRWIQLISVGASAWVKNPWIHPEVVITNTKGLYSDSVSEYALWALLTLSRKFHVVMKNQTKHRWKHVSGAGLKGKVLGILGLGQIGKQIAIRAKGFGLRIVGITRQMDSIQIPEAVDEVYPVKDLRQALRKVDFLVLCVPLTHETRELIGVDDLNSMKQGSMVINLCRAEVMREGLVIQAIKDGKLAGAALDVFEKEPLSRWSRLWGVDNLVVTPHLAALTYDYRERVCGLICKNIERFRTNQPLLNVVDREKGY